MRLQILRADQIKSTKAPAKAKTKSFFAFVPARCHNVLEKLTLLSQHSMRPGRKQDCKLSIRLARSRKGRKEGIDLRGAPAASHTLPRPASRGVSVALLEVMDVCQNIISACRGRIVYVSTHI